MGRFAIVGLILSSAKSAFVASRPAVFAGAKSQSTPPKPTLAASRALSAPLTPRVTAPFSDTNIESAADAGRAHASTALVSAARSRKSRRVSGGVIGVRITPEDPLYAEDSATRGS